MNDIDISDFIKSRTKTVFFSFILIALYFFRCQIYDGKFLDLKIYVFLSDIRTFIALFMFSTYLFIGYSLKYFEERKPHFSKQDKSYIEIINYCGSLLGYQGLNHISHRLDSFSSDVKRLYEGEKIDSATIQQKYNELSDNIEAINQKMTNIPDLIFHLKKINRQFNTSKYADSAYYYLYDILIPVALYLISTFTIFATMYSISR